MGSLTKDDFKEIKQNFSKFWPVLLNDFQNEVKFEKCHEAVQWLNTVLTRNVPKGKQNRAMAFIIFYKELLGSKWTAETQKLSHIVGWLIEVSQAAALIADDIMDESETRRGENCWYREKEVGLSAVNDVLFLENISYFMLYKYFSNEDYFQKLLAFCHDIILKTVMGQCMDTRNSAQFDFNLEECTLEKYKRIVQFKTSYYTFYNPYAVALIMTGVTDPKIFAKIEQVTMKMGYLFQVQDDFLDCYGNVDETGKIGTDITDKKCTWLLVTALKRGDERQKEILKLCYSTTRIENEKMVRQVYDELHMQNLFKKFETKIYTKIGKLILDLPEGIPQAPLMTMLNALYRRKK